MRLSHNFTKTSKDIPSDETSRNAQLLIKAGFIHKAMAGVYAYLPLGLRVLGKIENIVRKNMNEIGGQEILMNSLHPKIWWNKTNRWDTVDVLFKLKSQTENEYALAPTHEEQISPLIKNYINSYKDLPDYIPNVETSLNDIQGNQIFLNAVSIISWEHLKKIYLNQKISLVFERDVLTNNATSCKTVKINKITTFVGGEKKEHEEIELRFDHKFTNINIDFEEIIIQKTSPLSVYQIQTKFRDELRSKAGLMRGREFRMKDMYDFHPNKCSQTAYFELITETYHKIFEEMGLKSYAVDASGGDFSDKFSREFQVLCEAGEDNIIYCPDSGFACNIEVFEEAESKWKSTGKHLGQKLKGKSAEIGNIFDLGQKWVEAFDISYTDENNQKQYPYMGCHGIGTSRCMGVIAEIYSDENGLKWPESVAPFQFYLITHFGKNEEINQKIQDLADRIYQEEIKIVKQNSGQNQNPRQEEIKFLDPNNLVELSKFVLSDIQAAKDEVLWDDRREVSLGEKLKDADLIGCPYQLIISPKSLEKGGIEVKNRGTGESLVVQI